jgi:hypothetical protein
VLQPIIAKEFRKSDYDSMDEFLNATHEFTDFRKPDNYVIKLTFDNTEDELIFKLKYGV